MKRYLKVILVITFIENQVSTETQMKKLIASKTLHTKQRTYFFNLFENSKQERILEITESKVVGPNKYQRTKIIVFDGDLADFIEIINKYKK